MKQFELAKALGLSKGRVSQLKARGMPVSSVDEAQRWRAANDHEGIGHKSRSDSVVDSAKSLTSPLPPRAHFDSTTDDPAGALARAREIELRAYNLIDAALKKAKDSQSADDYAALPGLLRSYNQANANFLESERAYEKHQRASGQVAPVEHLLNVLRSRLEPLAAQLTTLPRQVAALANPTSPEIAERAIAAALESIRRQISAAQSPIPAAPAAS